MITKSRAIEIAGQWHSVMTWSDPGVCMYALSSTGNVQSAKHRQQLLAYIDSILDRPGPNFTKREKFNLTRELLALRRYCEEAPIEVVKTQVPA